jgi:hypothetical protein
MKIEISKVISQVYVLPFVKITYDRFLNGNYELILGWLNYAIVISWEKI